MENILSNKEGILFIHGFTGTPEHFKQYADNFEKKGYVVDSVLLSGHGTQLSNMIGVKHDVWINDILKAYDDLRQKVDKIHVVGLSMGTLLSVVLSSKRDVASLSLISPPIFVKNKSIYFSGLMKNFNIEIKWSRKCTENLSKEMLGYNNGYDGFYISSAYELLSLIKITRSNLSDVSVPTFVVISKNDELVSFKSGKYVIDNIKSKVKKLLVLEDAPHVCILSDDRYIVEKKIEQFINNKI